ncbi:hypothetical protein K4K58_008389 [Colletotrichum sp. SAR11_239]|nr:hypothetical protein K4K58_008389 [Colletotrichum sp. SAR11_239]
MHSADTLKTRINSFLQKLPALEDLTALDDNVVRYLVDFEKAVASEVDFLEFRDRLPAKAVDIFVYCIGRSDICGAHHRSKPKLEKTHVENYAQRIAQGSMFTNQASSLQMLLPSYFAKKDHQRFPVARREHSEDNTHSDEEPPETARNKTHYPEDDEWSLGWDPPDFGSNDGFPSLSTSPSPPHDTSRIASPENFSVDVSEVDIINLRPAFPITTIGDHAPISPDRQLSSPNARNIEASPRHSVQLQLPSPDESDFSVLDVNIDPNASINTSASMDLTNVTIKRPRAQSDAAGTSSKRPKLPVKPDNNEGSDDPPLITHASQWVSSKWLQDSLDVMTIGIDGVVVVDSSVLESLDKADYTRHRKLAAMVESHSTTSIVLPMYHGSH